MSRRFFILNHPERVFVKENSTYLEKVEGAWRKKQGEVVIPSDSLKGNIDPYIYHRPWLFGFCKVALLPGNMGEGSGVVYGKYHQSQSTEKEQYLVDTIITTNKRFYWTDENGNTPSAAFNEAYPIQKGTKNYMDFIKPRVEDGEHLGARYIFTSRTLECEEDRGYILRINENKDYFSCIPLMRGEDGIFRLIDIMPIILKQNPEYFKNYKNDPKKLYEVENSMLKEIFNYVLEKANILVIQTEGKGAPEELDMELQYKYYKTIYDETVVKKINWKCKKICRIKDAGEKSKEDNEISR